MIRNLLTAAIVLLIVSGEASASPLEKFLSKDQQFWQEGLAEFIKDSSNHIHPESVVPAVLSKLEFFTSVADSYQIPVEELERAYYLAVLRTAKRCMGDLEREVLRNRINSDSDVAFLMEDLTGYLEFSYRNSIRQMAEKIGPEELRRALSECRNLELSPMINGFLKSGDCKSLLKELPSDVESVIFSEMERRERELTDNPGLTREPTLRLILVNLKKFGLIGG